MTIPRVGDTWEFYPAAGKSHTTKKEISAIYWKSNSTTGGIVPWIEWSHTPKARYIPDMRVKHFLAKRAKRLVCRAQVINIKHRTQ